MNRYLPLAAAAILLGTVAVVQGFWTERWGKFDNEEIERRVYRLTKVPMKFGRWEGTDTEQDKRQLKIAKVSGVIQRVYKNLDTGTEVNIYLATGKARAISVHTPDRCYAAMGFRLAEDQVAVPIKFGDKQVADFYMGHFRKDTTEGAFHLQIFWSWNATGDKWEAPTVPKITFAKYPALYKLYAIRQLRPGETLQDNPTIAFLKEFLPVLDEALSAPASTGLAQTAAQTDSSRGKLPAAREFRPAGIAGRNDTRRRLYLAERGYAGANR